MLGLLSGLAAAHHQTIVLLAPALLVLLVVGLTEDNAAAQISKKRSRRPKPTKPSHIVGGIAMIGVGLLAYLWLPISAATDPVVNFDDPETFDRFRNVVTRGPYGSFELLPGAGRGGFGENLGLYFSYLFSAFTPIGIALGLAGWVYLAQRFRIEFFALLAAFLATGPTFVLIGSSPINSPLTEGIVERFYMLSSVFLAVAIGAGVLYAMVGLGRLMPKKPALVIGTTGVIVLVLAATLAVLRWDRVDQSDNHVAENYGRDLLANLDPNAVLLTRGDHNYTSLVYAQHVDGIRPDVVIVEAELLQLRSYVAEMKERYPDVEFPFAVYNESVNSLVDFVEANLDNFSIYLAGPMPEDLVEAVDEVRWGLVRKVMPQDTADLYEALIADPALAIDLNYPDRTYPDTTWERLITRQYGNTAHALGFALHEDQPTDDDALVEEMYQLSIDVGPPAEAYKNYGLFLFQRNRDATQIVELWETYIELGPDDAQIPAIEQAVRDLKAGINQGG